MAKEEMHPVTGGKYIRGEQKVIFENGILCSVAEFEKTLLMTKPEIEALMQEWSEDHNRYKFDYRYAVTTGLLRHKAAQPSVSEEPETVEVSAAPARRVPTPRLIILFVMCAVGALAAVMSAYHTTVANVQLGRPLVVGLITGTVMVLFSATAFTAARWFMAEKGPVRLFALVFLGLGCTIILYSMLSTLVVSYNAWNKTEIEKKAEKAADSEELSSVDLQINLKKEEIKELKDAELKLTEEADYWKDKSWKRYDALEEQIAEAGKKIAAARAELTTLISERPQIVSKAGEEQEDVFTFLSSFIKVNTRTLRLFMQAVPAMFFDVIAPFALSCAMYLAEKKEENKDE